MIMYVYVNDVNLILTTCNVKNTVVPVDKSIGKK